MALFGKSFFSKVEKGKLIIATDENEEEKAVNQDEIDICNYFIDKVKDEKNDSAFSVQNISDNYTTLKYGTTDVIRVKYTDRAKWISIFVSNEDRKKYYDSPLFENQENKGVAHWKSYIDSFDDLETYVDIVRNACIDYSKVSYSDFNESEQPIVDYFSELLHRNNATEEYIQINKRSSFITIYTSGYNVASVCKYNK